MEDNKSGISDEQLAELRAIQEHRDAETTALHLLRGQLISYVNILEGQVDHLIRVYFRPGHGREDRNDVLIQFNSWLLRRLSLSVKREILKQILTELSLDREFRPVLDAINRINLLRDEVAHSTVGLDMRDLTSPERFMVAEIQHSRTTKKGQRSRRIEIQELIDACELVGTLSVDTNRVGSAIAARLNGASPEDAVRTFDQHNPASFQESVLPVDRPR
jgi:hypothetical protein